MWHTSGLGSAGRTADAQRVCAVLARPVLLKHWPVAALAHVLRDRVAEKDQLKALRGEAGCLACLAAGAMRTAVCMQQALAVVTKTTLCLEAGCPACLASGAVSTAVCTQQALAVVTSVKLCLGSLARAAFLCVCQRIDINTRRLNGSSSTAAPSPLRPGGGAPCLCLRRPPFPR